MAFNCPSGITSWRIWRWVVYVIKENCIVMYRCGWLLDIYAVSGCSVWIFMRICLWWLIFASGFYCINISFAFVPSFYDYSLMQSTCKNLDTSGKLFKLQLLLASKTWGYFLNTVHMWWYAKKCGFRQVVLAVTPLASVQICGSDNLCSSVN